MVKSRKNNTIAVPFTTSHVNNFWLLLFSGLFFSYLPLISSLFHHQQSLLFRDDATKEERFGPFLTTNTRMNDSDNKNESEVIIEGFDGFSKPYGLRISTDTADSGLGLHRRRTLYLIRHGEAEHNVLEAIAQKKAKKEAEELNLSQEETHERMEQARKSVLNDKSLQDAKLTERGREQAREASNHLRALIDSGQIHHPTEAICSPLSRCLETCKILLDDADFKAHIRPEIAERRTLYPPDKPGLDQLLRATRDDDRFSIVNLEELRPEKIDDEAMVRESKEMLRERANDMFDLLMECEHRHVLVVSHKGFLRELERGLLEMPESPLFGNCEIRVYQVIFTIGERELFSIDRIA